MRLYNVTFNMMDDSNLLIPYIPFSAGPDEDRITKRICLADSIEHCFQALCLQEQDFYEGREFLLREIEVDIEDENLVFPEELWGSKRVPDAVENQEYWYLKPVKCKVSKRMILDVMQRDYEMAWSCIHVNDLKEIANILALKNKEYNLCFNTVVDEQMSYGSQVLFDALMAECYKKHAELIISDLWDMVLDLPWSTTSIVDRVISVTA